MAQVFNLCLHSLKSCTTTAALPPADWRAGAAALAFLAEQVWAGGDRPNAHRPQDLAEKAKGIAGWREGLQARLDELEEAQAELAQDDAD